MEKFAEQIMKNLENNGYPEKRVSLPTEKMYEIADSKGLSLNKVLDYLKENQKVGYEIGDEKIIFSPVEAIDFSHLDQEDMMGKAQEMMANMDPTQIQEIKKMYENMSASEKENILKQAKDMGLY